MQKDKDLLGKHNHIAKSYHKVSNLLTLPNTQIVLTFERNYLLLILKNYRIIYHYQKYQSTTVIFI
jgi:hypothetical protein